MNLQRSITLTANVKIPPMGCHRDPETGKYAEVFCAGRSRDGWCDDCVPAELTCKIRVIADASAVKGMVVEADALRRCAQGLVNDRPCEQIAAKIGEAVVALLAGASGILGVEVTLTHPNGDAVEWAAEAYLGIEIED